MPKSARETFSIFSLIIFVILILSSFSPLTTSEPIIDVEKVEFGEESNGFQQGGSTGKKYLFNNVSSFTYSASSSLKKQWIEDGYPGLNHQNNAPLRFTKNNNTLCENAWEEGDIDNITSSDGVVTSIVEKVSANAAIFIEEGNIISSTTLNDITSTWESIIYPTNVNYFGQPPDVDNNCQIEIVILSIDGPGEIGGYFQPSISSLRDSIFIDIDDLSNRNGIIAHEFAHLIHNSKDPYEYIWVDEGLADLASYVNFGVDISLAQHANSWTENTSKGLRWWNQRIEDYGSAFLFFAYIEEKLGGAAAIRSLVMDTAIGGQGIENLANNPRAGSTLIGSNMNEIFANFSIAVTLDSSQGSYGFSHLDFSDNCLGENICRAEIGGENMQWSEDWQSSNNQLEGWGMKSFKFSQGNGDPLNIMVQPDRLGFKGVILQREASSGTLTMSKLRIDSSSGIGTGLIHGFGNTTSEVWLFVWYNSLVDDCDYDFANCGILSSGSYPSGFFTVNAGLISDTSELTIQGIESFDRDGDTLFDSVKFQIEVTSFAYYEILSLTLEAYNSNSLTDSIQTFVSAGDLESEIIEIWFSPPETGDWSFFFRLDDINGLMQDQGFSLPIELVNIKPVSSGSISSNTTQTWLPNYFFGGGFDQWGFGLTNGTFTNNETPVSYFWDFGDGNTSNLKNPIHSYLDEGMFDVTLVVKDRGGFFSESTSWRIYANDSSAPIPEISVDGKNISDGLTLKTNQRAQFSAIGTLDNLPISEILFTWEWGDGDVDSGVGLYEIGHEWTDGSADGTLYTLKVTADDGKQISEISIKIKILNREPELNSFEDLQTFTLTPLELPELFTDHDGSIVGYSWQFEGGVSLDGDGMNFSSNFNQTISSESNPTVGWISPGLKNITLQVEDDDGNLSSASIQVTVYNQRPVAIFERPEDGDVYTAYIFDSESFDPDGQSSQLTHIWKISDMDDTIENISSVSRTFSEPGTYSVSLVVIDSRGLESAPKIYLFEIENPLPIPSISFDCPSIEGKLIDFIPKDFENITWQIPWTQDGGAFLAPNKQIRFDGSESGDADPIFIDKNSIDSQSLDWNGISQWIWDFGDSSPPQTGPVVWHNYERPGIYSVKLTVIDSFEGGDSNSSSITVYVSESPKILTQNPINDEYVVVGEDVDLMENITNPDNNLGIEAWLDSDDEFDSDGDGIVDNDKDRILTDVMKINWDLNIFIDDDMDGNFKNDWIDENSSWDNPGEVRISLSACNGLDVCSVKDFVITVLTLQDTSPPKTLADLTWNDLIPDRESSGILVLVVIVALMGWLVMREKDEDELDAQEMSETYIVDEIEAEGGLPGMDQHVPPPKPKYLTTDERRSTESGYVRPIRTGRRK